MSILGVAVTAIRVIIFVATVDAVVQTAQRVNRAIPQARQGYREAKRQRQLLKNPRLEYKGDHKQ